MISQLSSHHSARPPSSASSAVGLASVLILDDPPANVLLKAVLEPLRQRVNAVDSDPGALEVIEELYP